MLLIENFKHWPCRILFHTILTNNLPMMLLLCSKYILETYLEPTNFDWCWAFTEGKHIQHIAQIFCLQYWKYFSKSMWALNVKDFFFFNCMWSYQYGKRTLFFRLRSFWPFLFISSSVHGIDYSQRTLNEHLLKLCICRNRSWFNNFLFINMGEAQVLRVGNTLLESGSCTKVSMGNYSK